MNETKKNRIKTTKFEDVAPTFNRVANIKKNKQANRYDYGKNNLLANELLSAICASVTASSCRSIQAAFVEGNGFKDDASAKHMVNPTQTADELYSELADVVGIFRGIALNVKYTATGDVARIYALDFQNVRKTEDGRYYSNDKLQEGSDIKKDRVYYDVYDSNEDKNVRTRRIAEQINEHGKQIGDIIYLFDKKTGQRDYPIPTSWAAMEEIESDAALGRLDWRNIKKGFRPDVLMTTVGEFDQEKDEKTGKSELDIHNANLKQFQGEDAASIFHMNVDDKEQAPTLQPWESAKKLNETTEAENRVGRRVCRGMEVPEVLVPGFAKSGQLGNLDEMKTTIKLFNLTIGKKQRLIQRAFEMLIPDKNWNVEPLDVIQVESIVEAAKVE
ncbi:MAG: hypothetical protein ACPGD8_00915 [Flavobacteriales bacterium]